MPRALFHDGHLDDLLFPPCDFALGVLHVDDVTQAQLFASATLDEILGEEALHIVVNLQDAVEPVVVLPHALHLAYLRSLVL